MTLDEYIAQNTPEPDDSLILATVSSANSNGISLLLAGQSSPTQKRYKRLVTGQTLAAGDRVLVLKYSGSYIILGKIGT